MRRAKSLAAALTAACMLLGLLPAVALAADEAAEGTTMLDLTETAGDSSGDGWSWDHAGQTLTLSGAEIAVEDAEANLIGGKRTAGIRLPADATVVLTAGTESTIRGADVADGTYVSCGIVAGDGLTITGGGKLTAAGGEGGLGSYGIYSSGGLTVTGGAEVEASGGGTVPNAAFFSGSAGIFTNKALTISDAVVRADGGPSTDSGGGAAATAVDDRGRSYGIMAYEGAAVSGGAVVEAAGGEAVYESIGLYSGRALEVSGEGTSLTGTGGVSLDISSGILTSGLTVVGAAVRGYGGDAAGGPYGYSAGIRVQSGDAQIGGDAEVETSGGRAVDQSDGLSAFSGSLTISDGAKVTAQGGGAKVSSGLAVGENASAAACQISAQAQVTATGGEAEQDSRGIWADGNTVVTVSDSAVVQANGGKAGKSFGIQGHVVRVSGGRITAFGETAESLGGHGISVIGNFMDDSPGVELSGGSTQARGKDGAMAQKPRLTGLILLGKRTPAGGLEPAADEGTGYGYLETRPAVSKIGIDPASASVGQGGSRQFTAATVFLDDSSLTDSGLAAWSVEGGEDAGTAIDGSGKLTVASGETAEALTVNVRSKMDETVTASAAVTVTKEEEPPSGGSGSGGGGGGGTTYFTLTAQAGGHGRISPSGEVRVARNKDQAFVFKPDQGHEVYDVRVDGESVGEAGSYTLEKVRAMHTLRVEFVPSFEDVAEDAWYRQPVRYAAWKELFQGTAPGRFRPDMDMSRAMLAAVLYRAAGQLAPVGQEPDVPFTDVDMEDWYGPAVRWAVGGGVVNGVGGDAFQPGGTVTREQLVTMLYRYAGSPAAKADLSDFPDGDETADWAAEAVAWAVEEGILTGKDGKKLDPQGTANRAEVAAILMRWLQEETD